MNKMFLIGLTTAMLLLGATTAALQAGAIKDAAALLKAKKYHLVDARPAKLLDQANPPTEALSISPDAAEADGRFVTAQRRIKALLAVRGMKDLALVFRAAKTACLSANYSDALGKCTAYPREAAFSTSRWSVSSPGRRSPGTRSFSP